MKRQKDQSHKILEYYHTYGGENSKSKEAALNVVPIVGVVFVDNVDTSGRRVIDYNFIFRQCRGNILQIGNIHIFPCSSAACVLFSIKSKMSLSQV